MPITGRGSQLRNLGTLALKKGQSLLKATLPSGRYPKLAEDQEKEPPVGEEEPKAQKTPERIQKGWRQ
ncbi:hypothetical protein NDU88_003518 [Pleurodeles waltl]|uniref:Uncharacterized protein n=1 Tax=Pleurodeles waltl TaxID=8319 RepID=A0AAV7UYN8_PLEWA|nr:hypothetical protein NDU88_003518 [Pleurodeles waltl]